MVGSTKKSNFRIRPADTDDVPLILSLIKELAEYEQLSHQVVASEGGLRKALFGEHPVAEAVVGDWDATPVGFALYFHNFSTFLGRPGIYLEDLYVKPKYRGKGVGRELLAFVARLAKERNCGRLEWSVLNWNESAIKFYKSIDAVPMDEWTVYRVTGKALEKLAE